MTAAILKRRCALIANAAALFAIGAAAQQQMPPTLRQRAAKEGHVHAAPIIDWFCCSDLTQLVKHSTLIVRGKVMDFESRLSDDEYSVFTDYTIDIQNIYKQTRDGSVVPGAKIQATRLGGHLLVDGHPVEYDASPPIAKGVVQMFFITCSDAHCSFTGFDGAVSLDNGHVSCGAKPDVVWKPYCGMNTDDFVSAVKEKVASSIATTNSSTKP
jgi:hypothetical protein